MTLALLEQAATEFCTDASRSLFSPLPAVASAPLYDSSQLEFAGMLTYTECVCSTYRTGSQRLPNLTHVHQLHSSDPVLLSHGHHL